MNKTNSIDLLKVFVLALCAAILIFVAAISIKIAVVAFLSGCVGYVLNADWKE